MEAKTWKFVENSFEMATRDSRSKMNKLVVDHDAKLTVAASEPGADPALAELRNAWLPKRDAWAAAYSLWQNTRASYGGGTQTLENLLAQLNLKPGPEQDSKIENWDNRIRAVSPKGSAIYTTLLPQGRAPFSEGSRDNMINEVKNLGMRLATQLYKPDLVSLSVEVTAFYNQLLAARTGQQGLEGDTTMDASAIEIARQTIATALYGNLGMLMYIFQATPMTVTGFFDLVTLRKSSQPPADPPAADPPAPPPGP